MPARFNSLTQSSVKLNVLVYYFFNMIFFSRGMYVRLYVHMELTHNNIIENFTIIFYLLLCDICRGLFSLLLMFFLLLLFVFSSFLFCCCAY